ncbi:hypothetical protein [Mesorhizobium sp.]|uniref:hypothetical protein n=1 Tax=Mesorhizobium sp. TaxID=1871066 RepID=UPI000FEA916A|nr:hypothetical protein [Mesorhizobium sp.]RWC56291.1 MAG: hypothetical protein EOS56_24500 [Mesorhizobium sp.]RWC61718.1 MAG: hypothetical protein EOS29_17705 [Mesorhizobium sp.]
MRLKRSALLSCGVVVMLVAWAPATVAHAGFFREAWGVITDPLKLDASTENVIHTVERTDLMLRDLKKSLDRSGATIDANIRDYISEIDHIIGSTLVSTDKSFSQILGKVSNLEKDLFRDADKFVTCSAQVTLQQMQVALASSLKIIGKSRPRFTLFGWEIGAIEITPEDIPSPIEGYDLLKTASQERLNALGPDDAAKIVEFVYGDMQRVAALTKCHYSEENELQARLDRDIYEYRRLHQVWAGLVQ